MISYIVYSFWCIGMVCYTVVFQFWDVEDNKEINSFLKGGEVFCGGFFVCLFLLFIYLFVLLSSTSLWFWEWEQAGAKS